MSEYWKQTVTSDPTWNRTFKLNIQSRRQKLSERERPLYQEGGVRTSLPVTDITLLTNTPAGSPSRHMVFSPWHYVWPHDLLCQWNSSRSDVSLPTKALRVSACSTKFSPSLSRKRRAGRVPDQSCVSAGVPASLPEAYNMSKKYTLVVLSLWDLGALCYLAYCNYHAVIEQ